MKTVYKISSWVILVLGVGHISATPAFSPGFTADALWFAGTGLALVFLGFISLPWFKQFFPFVPAKRGLISVETPIQATQYVLDHHLSPQLFHDMAFGSYLIWAAQPTYKVFVDSRIELFPEVTWDDYWAISSAQSNWSALLEKYQVDTLMLEPVKQAVLIEAVKKAPGWALVYEDPAAVIYARK